ncbi:nuclear pore complex protein NUP50A-like [Olea europaea var. sylvestris]|uniref:nuclear pore complex protein NUP50A-like n=1 Tax=Olea europaea var. sylvestris TaxID=158386 RepID=UPI000C1CF2D8|nr:nuclear pore complex protein NUP50A-like [Olea europaea var. sylvestris]
MGDEENNFQPSKKRAAGVQLSRDNPGLDDDGTSEPETGSFKKASDEVLASRRIVKVRRHQTSTPSVPTSAPAPSSNPFAAIHLVPLPGSATSEKVEESGVARKEIEQIDKNDNQFKNKVDEPKDESTVEDAKTDIKDENAKQSESEVEESKAELNAGKGGETDDVSEPKKSNSADEKAEEGEKSTVKAKKPTENVVTEKEVGKDAEAEKTEENGSGDKNIGRGAESSPFGSFQQLSSSQNAFTGLTGTGFSSSTFSFGSIPKDGSPPGSGSNFGLKNDLLSFGFGASGNGSSSIFGTSGPNINNSGGNAFSSMQEVPVETGEENEKVVFTADSVLFEFIDEVWKERGKGELKVNVSTTGIRKARLIMRARGNYRLILNAGLFPDMKLTNMDKKGITFACVNTVGEGKDGLSTFALKFKDASIVEEFRAAVTEHRGNTVVPLKTPENSP